MPTETDLRNINLFSSISSYEDNKENLTDKDLSCVAMDEFPIGHIYFSINQNVPVGSLPLLGGIYSREVYADLWNYAQENNLVISDSEWKLLYSKNDGNVSYYSDGDSSTTFRVPSIRDYIKGSSTISEVGNYIREELPNISARVVRAYSSYNLNNTDYATHVSAPFYYDEAESMGTTQNVQSGSYDAIRNIKMDLSKYSDTYVNGGTVRPKSIVGVWLVKAFGTISNVGNIDIASIAQDYEQLNTKFNSLLDFCHPIGSLYWSKNPTDPSILFGGTWIQIKDKFILAAGDSYAQGASGGEATHTLTVNEMPSHNHSASSNSTGGHAHDISSTYCVLTTASGGVIGHGSGNTRNTKTGSGVINSNGSHSHTVTVGNTGSGQAHNNMPPYVTYYCWERTA